MQKHFEYAATICTVLHCRRISGQSRKSKLKASIRNEWTLFSEIHFDIAVVCCQFNEFYSGNITSGHNLHASSGNLLYTQLLFVWIHAKLDKIYISDFSQFMAFNNEF